MFVPDEWACELGRHNIVAVELAAFRQCLRAQAVAAPLRGLRRLEAQYGEFGDDHVLVSDDGSILNFDSTLILSRHPSG